MIYIHHKKGIKALFRNFQSLMTINGIDPEIVKIFAIVSNISYNY